MGYTTRNDLQLVLGSTNQTRALNQPAESTLVAFSISGVSPYLEVYNLRTLTKLPDPAVIPTTDGDGVAFYAYGKRLVVCYGDFFIVYSMPDFTAISGPNIGRGDQKNSVKKNKNENLFALAESVASQINVTVYDGETITQISPNIASPTALANNVAFNNANTHIAVVGARTKVYELDGYATIRDTGQIGTGFGCAYAPDDSYFAAAGQFDLIIYDPNNGYSIVPGPAPGYSGRDVAFSPANDILAYVGTSSTRLNLYDPQDNFTALPNPPSVANAAIASCAFSRGGRFFVTAGQSSPEAYLYRVNGQELTLYGTINTGGQCTHVAFN